MGDSKEMEAMLLTSIRKDLHNPSQHLSQVMITAAQYWWFLCLPFSLPFNLLAPVLHCQGHHWISATPSGWRRRCPIPCPQTARKLRSLGWFKGMTVIKRGIALYEINTKVSVMGPKYSGRETLYRNGSLLIHNVTQRDTGFYTLWTINRHGDIVSTSTYLHVNRDSL